jgi:cytochrome c-type biogenesis protein CcmH/NrfG
MNRLLTVVGVFALLVVSAAQAHAQMGIVRGKVVDQGDKPVAEATVEFAFTGESNRQYTTKTDKGGWYTQMVASGPYHVTVTKDGYQGMAQDVRVPSGTTTPTVLPTVKIVDREVAAREAMAPILEQFKKADELAQAGKMDEAIAVYEDVKAQHPNIVEAYFNLGSLYARQEKWPEAEAEYQKVIELQPDNSMARVLLAQTHRNMGRADEAVAEVEQLIAENPDDPELYYNLGVFYLNAQRYEDAFKSFDKVRTLDPDNLDVLYLLGTLSLNLGETQKAVDFFQSYLDKAPEDAQYRATASELLSKIQAAESSSQ